MPRSSVRVLRIRMPPARKHDRMQDAKWARGGREAGSRKCSIRDPAAQRMVAMNESLTVARLHVARVISA